MTLTPAQKIRSQKRSRFLAADTAHRTLFASVYGLGEYVMPFNHKGERVRVNADRALAVGDTPLKWLICCYALCRDNSGNNYTKAFTIQLTEPVKQSAINKSLSHAHYDWMKKEVNMKHLLTLAWIATTGNEPSGETAFRMFDSLGAWDKFEYVIESDDGGYLTNRKAD